MDYRLKKQKDFDLVFKKGTRINTKSLTLIYLESKETKFGISLSKKHGKAFKRNRIKRLLRASTRTFIKNFKGSFYVVILPKVLENYDFWELNKDLEFSLKRGKIISD